MFIGFTTTICGTVGDHHQRRCNSNARPKEHREPGLEVALDLGLVYAESLLSSM